MKKILTMLMVAVLAISMLAGCGGKTTGSVATDGSTSMEKVFERFYQVDKSHSKQSGGTGLGLSIVKHAVQYHHGKVSVESELNKGTTISVLFDTRV